MKKKLIGLAIVVLVTTAATVGAMLFIQGQFSGIKSNPVINVANLRQQILSIGELATIEYDYTNVVDLKSSRSIKGWEVPGTTKSLMVMFDGTMKIGIAASGISIDIHDNTQTISIAVPKAKILSHEIHENTVKVLNQKSGLFNPVKIDDYNSLLASQKQAMQEKVSAGDTFARAENDAAKMLQAFLEGIVREGYTVEIAVGTT